MEQALVCNIQRFSVHDGPGIRTTIFFKGCPLSCRWCHNPETISFRNELLYSPAECIGCGDCLEACPRGALKRGPSGIVTDPARCNLCLECTEICPSEARVPAARFYDSAALLDEALSDRDFYGEEGGITLSGGEPLAQADFLKSFLYKAKAAGLHVTAQTSGFWRYEALEGLLDSIDLFFYDLKAADARRHQKLTGRSNGRILSNLKRLIQEGREVQVRMPLVAGLNDDWQNIEQTAQLLGELGCDGLTLLPYHELGAGKREKLGMKPEATGLKALSETEFLGVRRLFEARGVTIRV